MEVQKSQGVSFGSVVNPIFSKKARGLEREMKPFLRYLKTVGGDSFEHNVTISNGFIGVGTWHTNYVDKVGVGGFTATGKDASSSEALIKLAKNYYEKAFGFLPTKHTN